MHSQKGAKRRHGGDASNGNKCPGLGPRHSPDKTLNRRCQLAIEHAVTADMADGHALDLAPVVAMLLRIEFDSGKTRTTLFRDCGSFDRKIVLLDRIIWFKREGAPGPSENHAWYIWNARHHGLPTIAYGRRS